MCLLITLQTSAQRPQGPTHSGPSGPCTSSVAIEEFIITITDPPYDWWDPAYWIPEAPKDTGLSVGASAIRLELPQWMMFCPVGPVGFDPYSHPMMGEMYQDRFEAPGTWDLGAPVTLTDGEELELPPYVDVTQVEVSIPEPSHVAVEWQVRGNAPDAWPDYYYAVQWYRPPTQDWDFWTYVLPFPDLENHWYSTIAFKPEASPAQAKQWQDLLTTGLGKQGGDYVLSWEMAADVPQQWVNGAADPTFTSRFDADNNRATGSWTGDDYQVVISPDAAGEFWDAVLLEWDIQWTLALLDLELQIEENLIKAYVPQDRLPLTTEFRWLANSGYSLTDPGSGGTHATAAREVYHAEVDAIPRTTVNLEKYRISLPVVFSDSES
jgi:hypothetical protein